MSIYDNETKIYPDLNPTAPQEPQIYRLNKLGEIEAYFLNEIEVREHIAKKNETIQYNYRYRRHSTNYINSDHWRNKHCSIFQGCWIAFWYCLQWN